MLEWLEKIFSRQEHHDACLATVERNQALIMAGIQELNDAIAALPQKVADSVIPLIPTPSTPPPVGSGVDTTVQIEALNKVPSQVASLVQAALSAGNPPPIATPTTASVTNADGSVTTTTINADGTTTVVTTDASGNVIPNP